MSGMISNQTTISDAHKSTAPTIPRLLYRGSLSLPDSNLLLDGLTFSIQLPSDDPQASRTLLETPLPLDLESMRGRPSLSLVGVVKLSELHCDFEEGASLHIHPRCILTKQFFVHNLCAESITSPQGRTELAIRVRLGEADATGPSPSDIVVYGRPHPSSSIMQLHVARIATAPASAGPPKPITTKPKPPRPDDPIPRKPPAGYAGIARIGLGMKRTASTASVGLPKEKDEKKMVEKEATRKKARKEEEARKFDEGVFKVPPVPPAKGKQETVTAPLDVFDAPPNDNGKPISELEAKNKMFIKRTAVRLLTAAGIGKQHADFKDFFNTIYRGVMFALRAKLKFITLESEQKEVELLERITQAHVTLYLGGQGLGIYLLQ